MMMSVTVRIIETYVKDVVIADTDCYHEAKEIVMNNRDKFKIDVNTDFCDCEYEEVQGD